MGRRHGRKVKGGRDASWHHHRVGNRNLARAGRAGDPDVRHPLRTGGAHRGQGRRGRGAAPGPPRGRPPAAARPRQPPGQPGGPAGCRGGLPDLADRLRRGRPGGAARHPRVDDLYFPGNRLPDGSLCTWHDTPRAAGRGHWIFGLPFSEPLRAALIEAGRATGTPVLAGGCYGHVDGPRFNSRAEIAALAQRGVTALSQTASPEVVLAGEAGLPMALAGYVTDYANGVSEPEPVEALLARMRQSTGILAALVEQALPRIGELGPVGVVLRFDVWP